jgi:CRP-like cAMP-binding protein
MSSNIKILNREFVPAGTLVIEQHTCGNRAFVIESGKVEVFSRDKKGNELHLAELGPESIVGEIASISDGLRTANVRTIDDCVLVYISAHELQTSMTKSEKFAEKIKSLVRERHKATKEKIELRSIPLGVFNTSELPEDIVILLTDKIREGLPKEQIAKLEAMIKS